MSYLNHSYNDTPVIRGVAGTKLTAPAMKAFAFDENGKVVLPAAAGEFAIGIALANAEDEVASGGKIELQIKDGCYAIAGETIKRGNMLAAYTDGTLIVAKGGQHVIAVALQDAAEGKPVEVFIIRTFIPAFAVDFTTEPTEGQVLKYDASSETWKPGDDETT